MKNVKLRFGKKRLISIFLENIRKSNLHSHRFCAILMREALMKKILITFVEAGLGHIVTAQAILDALEAANDGSVEIIAKDVFKENKILVKHENFLIKEVKRASSMPLHSNMQLFFMKLFGSQNTLKFVHSTIYHNAVRAYVEELNKIKPDVIIDTHFFTSYASICYRDKYNPDCKVITYNPDNNVHGWWCLKVDYFIVNNELAYKQALAAKFPPEKLKKVFFIVRKAIVEANESKEFYRRKYGIPLDRFAVKIADGAYAQAKLESFVEELIKTDKPLTIVAIAGKNEEMYNKLVAMKDKVKPNINLMPFGFVQDIHELFKACDLFITKAGPNAVLDSVFMQTPVMIDYWANKIEWTTKELFVNELGCGVIITDKVKAREFVEACIDDRSLLDEYIANEKKLDKTKNGATEVAAFVLDKIKQ